MRAFEARAHDLFKLQIPITYCSTCSILSCGLVILSVYFPVSNLILWVKLPNRSSKIYQICFVNLKDDRSWRSSNRIDRQSTFIQPLILFMVSHTQLACCETEIEYRSHVKTKADK